jgi:nucleotide-binding universal stress UspA family protein
LLTKKEEDTSTEETPITKMLVAIDGSEAATKALAYALSLAEKCDAEVQIVSVVPPVTSIMPRFALTAPPVHYTMFLNEVEKRLQAVLSDALKEAKEKRPTLNLSIRLLKGHPADKIVQTAEEEGFDIIVVGSRGLSGVEELVLGSVSDRVADRATCPVLIVK